MRPKVPVETFTRYQRYLFAKKRLRGRSRTLAAACKVCSVAIELLCEFETTGGKNTKDNRIFGLRYRLVLVNRYLRPF